MNLENKNIKQEASDSEYCGGMLHCKDRVCDHSKKDCQECVKDAEEGIRQAEEFNKKNLKS